MKLAIMQPYFMPYLGYWQLLNTVDKFVVYDNIQFTKRGWFQKNQFLLNGRAKLFTLPLKKDSDFLDVNKRFLAESSDQEINKILRQIKSAYIKAPNFKAIYELTEKCFKYNNKNLFEFILNSIITIKDHLEIKTELIPSSTLNLNHNLKGQDRVIDICLYFNANIYTNAVGGKELYNIDAFKEKNIELKYIKMNDLEYTQFSNDFIPFLSIIDVLMFNTKEEALKMLNQYCFE